MLTETKIKRLARPAGTAKLYSDHNGLYLKHASTGRKTWVFRSRRGGKWTVKKLGEYPAIPLSVARARVAVLSESSLYGIHTRTVVDEFWDLRIEKRYKQKKNSRVYADRLRDRFGNQAIDQLTTRILVDDLKTYAKAAPVAANRCLSFWKLIFRFGVESGYLTTSPLQCTSTATVGGSETERSVTLTDDEITALLDSDHKHAPLLRALLLTGCRISELQAARGEHIKGDTLHIPDTKSSRPHWVHITPRVRDQFGDFKGRLFEGVSPTAVQSRLRRTNSRWTPHDLRRTFATIAARYSEPYVVEKCLNHEMQGVMKIYNRHDYAEQRRTVSVCVSEHIAGVING